MNILREIQNRFAAALAGLAENPAELLAQVRSSQDAKFGDYQANCAMPLGKKLGKPPREIANEIIGRLKIDDLCEPPTIAGPGFINLKLKPEFVAALASAASADARLGVPVVAKPRTYVVDYSAPNVAKPMHVGHIRSTVIGDCLYRALKFLGHKAISDNHLGDWGTQFGMIIYGYKHFLDKAAFETNPIKELSRLYKLVSLLVTNYEQQSRLNQLAQENIQLTDQINKHQALLASKGKEVNSKLEENKEKLKRISEELHSLQIKRLEIENDSSIFDLMQKHPTIAFDVLKETAKLHEGDVENVALWKQFMPVCLEDIERIYRRLHVQFDETLGESFYHDRLAATVADLEKRGLAKESDGALCVFIDGIETPMIVRKKDGAFLYATTDLATIQYRMEKWQPDAILYVVDHRQSLHFEQLFATARLWKPEYANVEYQHIIFGTVLGKDNKPFKTRSGDTVGLESLLDEGVARALAIVSENDDGKPNGPELSAEERKRISEVVGIGALKYADLSQSRTSDYVFDYDKMLAMNGNTATYLQYAYARVKGIFIKGVSRDSIEERSKDSGFGVQGSGPGTSHQSHFTQPFHPAERALVMAALQLPEALESVLVDYRPNLLTNYLFELANRFSTFYENCPVLKAETPELLASRLTICDLTAKVLKQGLALLGIDVVERM